jgi:plasmid replication initiation protein
LTWATRSGSPVMRYREREYVNEANMLHVDMILLLIWHC